MLLKRVWKYLITKLKNNLDMNNSKILKDNELFLSGKGLLPKSYKLMGLKSPNNNSFSNATGDDISNAELSKQNNKKALVKMTPIVLVVSLIIGVSLFYEGK